MKWDSDHFFFFFFNNTWENKSTALLKHIYVLIFFVFFFGLVRLISKAAEGNICISLAKWSIKDASYMHLFLCKSSQSAPQISAKCNIKTFQPRNFQRKSKAIISPNTPPLMNSPGYPTWILSCVWPLTLSSTALWWLNTSNAPNHSSTADSCASNVINSINTKRKINGAHWQCREMLAPSG